MSLPFPGLRALNAAPKNEPRTFPVTRWLGERGAMVFLVLWLVALIAATIHVTVRREHAPLQRATTFFLYQLVLAFGLMGLMGFTGHVLQPAQTAARIGWPPSVEFQRELGFFSLGFSLAAVLGLVFRNRYYWLGAWIAPAVFLVGAGLNHVLESVRGNMAPYNVWTSLPDLLIPLTVGWFLLRVFRLEPRAATA